MASADRTIWLLGVLAGALLVASAAQADDWVLCTPEFYYNSSESPPVVIAIDEARAHGSVLTHVDLETGAYREHFADLESDTLHTGTFKIVNPGSRQERIDFVAVDTTTALLIHISLIDEGWPFVRVDKEGTVSSGHCVYE